MQQTYMKTKPVLPLVLSMSIPMMLSMMVSSLYNIVDSYYVAKISEDAMTALSLVYPVQNMISAVTIGFAVGANAVISFFLGARDGHRADQACAQAMLWNGLHGIVLTVVCIAVMPGFLSMFTQRGEIIDLGVRYCNIAFSFSLAVALSMTMEKIFQATGRMMITMICMMSGCVANIILDPLMIFGIGPFPAMGIEGAALATGIGQTLGLVIYLVCYRFMSFPVKISFHGGFDFSITRRMYSVGVPAALNIALPSLMISCLNMILSVYSQTYVLVLGVYYKLQTFLYLPANGIVQGMRPVVGYNYGAGEMHRVRSICLTALLLSGCIMLAGTVLCQAVPEWLIGLFSHEPQTILAGAFALRVISMGFVISSVSVIVSGALEALGMGSPSLVISLLRYAVVIIPVSFLLSGIMGPRGVWHAFWITELIAAAVSCLLGRGCILHTAPAAACSTESVH